MRYVYLLTLMSIVACQSNTEMPEFVTDDPVKLEEYADQALKEADQLLDSLEQTPILDPSF